MWDLREKLLGSGEGKPRINGRKFSLRSATGKLGLDSYIAALAQPLPTVKLPTGAPDITFGGDYTKDNANEVEVDCLIKLALPTDASWERAMVPEAGRIVPFFIEAQGVPLAPPGPLPPQLLQQLPPQRAPPGSFSQHNYHTDANFYVVGELYCPDSRGAGGGLKRSAQKLLQLERILHVLSAKEGVEVEHCVIGVVLLGPHMNKATGAALAFTLYHYRQRLPNLWRLQQLRRFMGLTTTHFFPEVAWLQVKEDMAAFRSAVATEFVAVRKDIADLKQDMATVMKDVNTISTTLELLLQRLPIPVVPS